MNEKTSSSIDSFTNEQLREIHSNETREMIVRLLELYTELSLPQLSNIMNLRKTTIQYHLQILRDKKIIYESKVSQEDSRGSIPTKYFKLKQSKPDYHVYFKDIKKITNVENRLLTYKQYLQSLEAGIRNLQTTISFALDGIESSKRKLAEIQKEKLTKEKFEELHEFIKNANTGLSTFMTSKSVYEKIAAYLPKVFEDFEKINKEFLAEERQKLKKHNYIDEEIDAIFKTNDEYIEGYEFIIVQLPLKNLINARLKNRKHKGE